MLRKRKDVTFIKQRASFTSVVTDASSFPIYTDNALNCRSALCIPHMVIGPMLYLISSWSKLSRSRPERSAIDSVLLNLPQGASFIFACIFAWAMLINDYRRWFVPETESCVRARLWSVQLSVAPPAAAAPLGEHFLTWAAASSLTPRRSFPRSPEKRFLSCGPRTPREHRGASAGPQKYFD